MKKVYEQKLSNLFIVIDYVYKFIKNIIKCI